jgi:acyl dehydratase
LYRCSAGLVSGIVQNLGKGFAYARLIPFAGRLDFLRCGVRSETHAMGLNQNCIGKVYPTTTFRVSEGAITEYASACNEDNPAFLDVSRAGGISAPPLFGAVATYPAVLQVASDPELGVDLVRLLHSEQDMEYLAPIRPDDVISTVARIMRIEVMAHGETLAVELRASNQDRVEVQRIVFTAFIRARNKARARSAVSREKREARKALAVEALRAEQAATVVQQLDFDQAVRYAKASGDNNPIHLSQESAKAAGLPGVIVHGLCTMAFASKAVIDAVCGRDPLRLKRLYARFARPVFPGQTLTTTLWPGARDRSRRTYFYETANPQGQGVIRDGVAEVQME